MKCAIGFDNNVWYLKAATLYIFSSKYTPWNDNELQNDIMWLSLRIFQLEFAKCWTNITGFIKFVYDRNSSVFDNTLTSVFFDNT